MEKKPIAWVDSPVYSKERKVRTGQTLQVPGLRMYGHHNTAHAISPLDTHDHRDCFEFTYLVHGNVRFSVEPRHPAAFCGPSGGGKTTAARLMPLVWDADSGTVKVG